MKNWTSILFSCMVFCNAQHSTNRVLDIPPVYSELNKCLVVLGGNQPPTSSSSCEHSNVSTSDSDDRCNHWLEEIHRVYTNDEKVIMINTEDDFVDVKWLFNSLNILLNPIKNTNCSIIVYTKPVRDRTCLMTPPVTKPAPPVVINKFTVEDAVNQVNDLCHTFRMANGDLNHKGLHRDYILSNMFYVKHLKSNITSEEAFTGTKSAVAALPTCDKIRIHSWKQFFTNYLQISKPVIIQNAMSLWKASTHWSNEYLRQKYGNISVHIKLSPTTDYEGVEKAELWEDFQSFRIPDLVRSKLEFPDLVVPRPAPVNMKFAQYLKLMQNISEGIVTNISGYLEYSSIRHYFPDLEHDITEMPFLDLKLKLKHLNMWLSDGNTLGKLHFDPFDNFLCMIDGRKELILFDPHNNSMLYETHIPEAQFNVDLNTYKFRRNQLLQSTSMVMSPFDIRKPDFDQFPMFKDSLPLNCTLEEGEVLFMPAFWWHEVQSYPSRAKRRNLAVNFWYEPFLTKEFPCAECRLDINTFYNDLL